MIFSFVLIGRCDYVGFGYTTLNRKALYVPDGCHIKISVFWRTGFIGLYLWIRHVTQTVPLSTQEYKIVSLNVRQIEGTWSAGRT